jgi:phosphonate degradation associated HDIG domain protein
MTKNNITPIVDEIFSLYEKYGAGEYAGEKVTQLQHMVQAGELAKNAGYDDEVILAAFLHDIGHILESEHEQMDGFGTVDHEKVGADFLRERGFSERLARLVENHVSAKRYLTLKNPAYYEGLSEASKKTLEYQGGRMTEAEAAAFESDELFKEFIDMRFWDEQAKIEDMPLASIEYYKNLMIKYLETRHAN